MNIDLQGKKILISRAKSKADEFADQIVNYGGQPIVVPLIKISTRLKQSHKKHLLHMEQYEWIFFTSANGVNSFFELLYKFGMSEQIKSCKIAAVGTKTNEALQNYGLTADFMPSMFNAETMASEFLALYKPYRPILLVRGQLSRKVLNEAFLKEAIPFDCLEVYATETNHLEKEHLNHVLNKKMVHFITFTSPSMIDAFMELAENKNDVENITIVCIGTTTAKHAKKYGFEHILTAKKFTVEGMLEVIQEYIATEDDIFE